MNVKQTVCAKWVASLGLVLAAAWPLGLVPGQAVAQGASSASPQGNEVILEAREAWRKRDRVRLASARASAVASRHPLASWTDYWDLNLRLPELRVDEVEAFYTRWPATYVEDRLRNDWLLELGRRRDWNSFGADQPRFRMNDDREVSCYTLLIEHQAGKPVREAALAQWLAQKDQDEGCALLAGTLLEARQFSPAELWLKARHAVEHRQQRAARQAVALLGPAAAEGMDAVFDNPARYLARKAGTANRTEAELSTIALMRLAANDLDAATLALNTRWEKALPSDLAAWAWAYAARQAAFKLQPDAVGLYDRAELLAERGQPRREARSALAVGWTDETIAWRARALLRQAATTDRGLQPWNQLLQTIAALSATEQKDPAWRYWKARALQVTALDNKALPAAQADAQINQARQLLETLAGELSFYGALAAEDLGRSARLPAPPAPLTAEERTNAVRHPGLERALQLVAIGLRGEGVREWNYSLRGMNDRELLAAAQWACDREVWDRCINTSDRTTAEVDLSQRYPMPYRKEVVARTRDIGLDPAYVYGLIRQESRFVMDARSHVGASGLMQVMPETARWTARKIGLPYSADMLSDRDTNLMLGTNYLKLVLDDLGGSQTLGAAAYNAGPNRLRRWRDGPSMEAAVWAENIPFPETRDYVKKVLSNALYYTARLTGEMPSMRHRLGAAIGARDASAPAVKELP